MESSELSAVRQIESLAHSILSATGNFHAERLKSGPVAIMKALLQNMQTSVNKIESLTKGLLEAALPGEFTIFPMLPAELRLKIWKMALPGPRIVEVYLDRVADPSYGDFRVIRTNTPPPTLLSVNLESRKVALEKYWLNLNYNMSCTCACYAQIDPTEDTIYIPWSIHNTALPQNSLINGTIWSDEARDSVRFMSIDERTWRSISGPDGFVYFENLQKFTIVAHEEYDFWLDNCKERWRMRDTDLSFVKVDDEETISSHHLSVESQMQFDNGHYERQWKLPVIEVKAVARGGKKCCYN